MRYLFLMFLAGCSIGLQKPSHSGHEPHFDTDIQAFFEATVEQMGASEDVKWWQFVWYTDKDVLTDNYPKPDSHCLSGFVDHVNWVVHMTPDATAHEIGHVKIIMRSNGFWNGLSHNALTGWTEEVDEHVKQVERDTYNLRPYDVGHCIRHEWR